MVGYSLFVVRNIMRSVGATSWAHKVLRQIAPSAVVEFDGCKMLVNPADNYTEYRLYMDGAPYEGETHRYVANRVRGRRVLFYDIGANAGVYALPVAIQAKADSVVLAFEPNPVMFGRLCGNISLNDVENVSAHQVALGDARTRMRLNFMRRRRQEYGRGTLLDVDKSGHSVEVDVVPLLAFAMDQSEFDDSILKIDVEGFEDRVLLPFFRSAPRNYYPKVIIMEGVHQDGWTVAVDEELVGLGYKIVDRLDGNVVLELGDD